MRRHRGPRRRMCVSHHFFKKNNNLLGCAIVSVCFPHSVARSRPRPRPSSVRVPRRAAPVREHTTLPRHSLRDHRTRVVGTAAPAFGSWLARTATAKIRGQEGCGAAGHYGTLFRCKTAFDFDRLPKLAEQTAHMGVFFFWFAARSQSYF